MLNEIFFAEPSESIRPIKNKSRRVIRGFRLRLPNTLGENSRLCLQTQQRSFTALAKIHRQQAVIIENQNRQLEVQERTNNLLEQLLKQMNTTNSSLS